MVDVSIASEKVGHDLDQPYIENMRKYTKAIRVIKIMRNSISSLRRIMFIIFSGFLIYVEFGHHFGFVAKAKDYNNESNNVFDPTFNQFQKLQHTIYLACKCVVLIFVIGEFIFDVIILAKKIRGKQKFKRIDYLFVLEVFIRFIYRILSLTVTCMIFANVQNAIAHNHDLSQKDSINTGNNVTIVRFVQYCVLAVLMLISCICFFFRVKEKNISKTRKCLLKVCFILSCLSAAALLVGCMSLIGGVNTAFNHQYENPGGAKSDIAKIDHINISHILIIIGSFLYLLSRLVSIALDVMELKEICKNDQKKTRDDKLYKQKAEENDELSRSK